MPFHLQFEASARFSHAVFHDITAAAAVVDLGSGGLVHFHAAIFRKIRVPGDAWVAAAADDGLVIDGFDLTPANSDVPRMPVVVRQRGVDVVCDEYFYVDDALVYDEQYTLFDYDYNDGAQLLYVWHVHVYSGTPSYGTCTCCATCLRVVAVCMR